MERERLMVFRGNKKENAYYKGYFLTCRHDGTAYLPGISDYMNAAYYRAKEQYVDNLTKRQQNAINLIRIMDAGDWVEGIGGKLGSIRVTAYILDC